MNVRIKKNKSGSFSVVVIACKRFPGKKNPQPIVIKSFGSSCDPKKIQELQQQALDFIGNNKYTPFLRINTDKDINSSVIKNIGFKQIYDSILTKNFKLEKLGLNTQTLKELIMMRIAEPVSKLKTSTIALDFSCNTLTLNKIYKLMDAMNGSVINTIKEQVFANTKNLLTANNLNVIFYDLTTIYFENNNSTEFKQLGFSKDGKSQHVQISLALMVTEHGLPIGYEIFPGNTFEGKTLLPTLCKLRDLYKIANVTIVADSAMLSNINIEALTTHGFKYIVAARIKNLNQQVTKQLLYAEDYIELNDDLRYKIITVDTQKIVICYSKTRAAKDEYERKLTLQRLEKFIGKNVKNVMRGSVKKPYVKINNSNTIEIDLNKLNKAQELDGYFGFYTNTNISGAQVIEQYRGLWQVEQTFRITKHNLAIRPVYHYKDSRILAHFALCFLALTAVRTVEYLLKQNNCSLSPEKLHQLLTQANCIEIIDNKNQKFLITPNNNPELEKVYSALAIPKLKTFTSENLNLFT